jgi:hypothetical protein
VSERGNGRQKRKYKLSHVLGRLYDLVAGAVELDR